MKTKHRHNLKENDLARLIGATREWAEPRGKQITAAIPNTIFLMLTSSTEKTFTP